MKTLTFKEIISKEELEDFFRFRYEIYSDSDNKIFLHENEYQIDMDHFDISARHYAIIYREEKAAYVRVVLPKKDFKNTEALEINRNYGLLDEDQYFENSGRAPFPFLSYDGVPRSHWEYYYELTRRNEQMMEASRIMVHPDFRSIRTVKFLIECTMALTARAFNYLEHSFVNCCVDHGSIYKRYGFKEVADNGQFYVNGLNKMSLTAPITLSSVPERFHKMFVEMGEEFITTNKIEREL